MSNPIGRGRRFGSYEYIGIGIDCKIVLYVKLLKDGIIHEFCVVERKFVHDVGVFGIKSKSEKEYLLADTLSDAGHRLPDRNLAKKVYNYVNPDNKIHDGKEEMHHELGQFICLLDYMKKLPADDHNALHSLYPRNSGVRFNMSAHEFLLKHVMNTQRYYDVLLPNLKLILAYMLENKISSNYVYVGDVCLYDVLLSSLENWQRDFRSRHDTD